MRISSRGLKVATIAAVNPFAGAIVGISHPRDRFSKNLVWVFTVFYGAVFYIADSSTSDSVRYADQLRMMNQPGFSFADFIALFFSGATAYQDIYQPLVTFLVSRVTGESWLLFGAFGILLGYVYSRNIWFLVDRMRGPRSLVTAGLVIAFALDIGVGVSLNGVRMWTALHVFVFGVLHFSVGRNARFLVIALLTPLIHFSFLLPCAVLLSFLGLRRAGLAIYVFFLASYGFATLDLAIIRNIVDYLPFTMEDRALMYVDNADQSGEFRLSKSSRPVWFLTLNDVFMSIFVLLNATWLFVRGYHRKTGLVGRVFLFAILMYGVTNIVAHVPGARRFYNIGEMLIIAAVVLHLSGSMVARAERNIGALFLPLLTINTALGVKNLLVFASPFIVVGNFLVAPFVKADQSLYAILGVVPVGVLSRVDA